MAEYTREQVAELYISYYDRAADAAGLDFWMTQTEITTIEGIATSFAEQDETKAKYPDSLTTPEYVNTIYNNVFGRDADPDGLAYWVAALDDGLATRGEMIIAIVNGATGADQDVLDNKVEIALYYVDAGLNDYDNAVSVVDGVTADDNSMISAKASIDQWEKEFSDFAMTTQKDELVGTEADESFSGKSTAAETTYQAIDSIDGGDGEDTLKLTSSTAAVAPATIKNVETLDLSNPTATATTINFANIDGAMVNVVEASGANVTLGTGVAGASVNTLLETLELNNTAAVTTTINYEARPIAGENDSLDITLASTGKQTVSANGIENFTVHSDKSAQSIDFTNTTAIKSVEIVGSQNVILDATGVATNITNIDASSSTGAITVLATAVNNVAGTSVTVKGGFGNDTITGNTANDTIYGNAGNDTITTGAGGTSLVIGGTGKDTMTSTALGKDTFKFADTGDTGSTQSTADSINTFVSGTDKIDIDTMAAGSAANYTEGTNASYDAALKAANASFAADAKVFYSFQDDSTHGYLFVDGDRNGVADTVIKFTSVLATAFASTDIIA